MKILVDENIPRETASYLKSAGHTVVYPKSGIKDREIMQLAERNRAILLTRDRDFLNVLPVQHTGIIYVRIHPSIAEQITQAVCRLLDAYPEKSMAGRVIILQADGYEIFR